jgi:serine/threonine protein kinase
LSDFDACLELAPDHSLLPDPARSSMQGFYTSYERTYHISPVGTIGFKPPEGFIHMLSNSSDSLPKISTKADIFSFGLVVLLCMLNEEGPKTINKVATLLLSINKKKSFKPALKSSLTDLNVLEADVDKILHRKKIKNTFKDIPHLADFMLEMIEVDPECRPSAGQLLSHAYLL